MPDSRHWVFLPDQGARSQDFARSLGVDDTIAQLLLNRQIDSVDGARDFMRPSLAQLHDPFLMHGMEQAVERVQRAIHEREKIVVYGDYDVDGTLATTVLMLFFQLVNANADYHIPRRRSEGYGLNVEVLSKLREEGASLIITVDTGIGAFDEIAHCNAIGLDVVVTDHHEPGDQLPGARAIVNPKLSACDYPHQYLCGAGVAFKLAWALAESFTTSQRESREFTDFLETAVGLVTIATVSDLVPLRDENRILTSYGLHALPRTPNPGIRALLEVCHLDGQPLDSSHIAFRLGPRLNAGGRLGKEDLGVRLLLSERFDEALAIAREMDDENKARQEIERAITEDARQRVIDEVDLSTASVIVMNSDEWHAGVIGIVSARLSDEFWRPAVLIATENGRGRGSARSIPGYNIYDMLHSCVDLMSSFGGHAYAAGLEITRANIPTLRDRLNTYAQGTLDPDSLKPSITLEGELTPSRVSLNLLHQLERLAPFGEGNSQPLFATPLVRLAGRPRIVGRSDQHLTFYVNDGVRAVKAIGYNMAGWYDALCQSNRDLKLAFAPRINRHGGTESPELLIKDIQIV